MRSYCTPESAMNGEITRLAIVETVVAISLSLTLMELSGTAAHIVLGALITPFLLLRTEASTSLAFSIFDLCFQKLTKPVSFAHRCYERLPAVLRSITFFLVWLPLFSLALVLIKSVATVVTLIASPRETLLAIPRNWMRIVLATDHRHPPELLPGVETEAEAPAAVQTIRYAEIRQQITSGTGSPLSKRLSLSAIYGPAVLYRLFVKSTSLIFFPMIWVSNMPMTVTGIMTWPVERLRRFYAYAIVLIMISPLFMSFPVQDTLATPLDRAVFTYVLPVGKIDWWHITRIIAVAATIGLYFYVRKLDDNNLENPEKVRRIITRTNMLRAACAVFTMGCFLLIVLTL